jgi:hypothetical protein
MLAMRANLWYDQPEDQPKWTPEQEARIEARAAELAQQLAPLAPPQTAPAVPVERNIATGAGCVLGHPEMIRNKYGYYHDPAKGPGPQDDDFLMFVLKSPWYILQAIWIFLASIPHDTMHGTSTGSKSPLDWRP